MKFLSDLYDAYMRIYAGEKINIEVLSNKLTCLKSKEYKNQVGAVMLVFNSGRLANVDLLRSISNRRHGLDNADIKNCHFHLIDVNLDKYLFNNYSFRKLAARWILSNFHIFLIGLLANRSSGVGIIHVFRKYLRMNAIKKLELYTCNNRLTELLRVAAILEGIQITEYLHGICSDVFADYYRLLHSFGSEGQLTYVNMAPRLPQPEIIRENIIRYNALEVYFRNETDWVPYSFEACTDVLIVGSDIPDADYWESELFKNDLYLIDFCIKNEINLIYCPHPLLFYNAVNHLPKEVKIGRLKDHINSAKVLVGHYSTVLFMAHLYGKNILIFKSSLKLIPKYFFEELIDREEVSFDEVKLRNLLNKNNEAWGELILENSTIGYSLLSNMD